MPPPLSVTLSLKVTLAALSTPPFTTVAPGASVTRLPKLVMVAPLNDDTPAVLTVKSLPLPLIVPPEKPMLAAPRPVSVAAPLSVSVSSAKLVLLVNCSGPALALSVPTVFPALFSVKLPPPSKLSEFAWMNPVDCVTVPPSAISVALPLVTMPPPPPRRSKPPKDVAAVLRNAMSPATGVMPSIAIVPIWMLCTSLPECTRLMALAPVTPRVSTCRLALTIGAPIAWLTGPAASKVSAPAPGWLMPRSTLMPPAVLVIEVLPPAHWPTP